MLALIPVADLTTRQRKQGIAALMVSAFFSWAAFFLVIPLMAVNYVDHLGWAPAASGSCWRCGS